MSSLVIPAVQFSTNVTHSNLSTKEGDIPDNYVAFTLRNAKPLPSVGWGNFWTELNWPHVVVLGLTPIIAVVGAFYTKLRWETALFSIFYYYLTAFGKSNC